MQQDKTFLGTEPVGQLLRRLAIPTVIAQLVNMLYNIVDRIYIGHIPEVGSAALTGVGVCLPIILIVSAFACFTASGGAPSERSNCTPEWCSSTLPLPRISRNTRAFWSMMEVYGMT